MRIRRPAPSDPTRPRAAWRLGAAVAALGCAVLAACDRPAGPDKPAEPQSAATADPATAMTDARQTDATKAEATTDRPSQTYSAEAFLDTVSVGLAPGHAFSPDGSTLLAYSDQSGVFNAYAIDLATGDKTALTNSDGDAIFPVSYFPDSQRFLYSADQGGNELTHVYVQGPDGTAQDLTPGDAVKASVAGWIEDDAAFVVATNERDPQAFDLYRYDAESYERSLLFENPGGLYPAEISDDGRWVVLSRANTNADSDLLLVDLDAETPEPRLITEHEGAIQFNAFAFTPEGDKLVYGTNETSEFTQAWTYDLETGETAPLIEADWNVVYVSYSPSGRYRVHGVNADARTQVTLTDRLTGDTVPLTDGVGLADGIISSVRFAPDETRVAFRLESASQPANLYTLTLGDDATARRLTDSLTDAIDAADLVEATVARFDSYDGLSIPGILYRPHQASAKTPVPALVWVHGGPGGQSRLGYNGTIQHLVNHGYAVYAINNRGSSGYGKTFNHLDDQKHGEADLGDVVASKDFLAAKDWIDGDAIGIIGGSYGGYMVAAALAFEPQVFDLGIDIFGVTNWLRTLQSIPAWWGPQRDALYDELGDPATDEDRLRRISPLFHADRIERPLLVVQGANDPRVLQVESDELVAAVRANGVPVDYVVFDDEGHGFRKKANRVAASEAYLRFLDSHLKGRDAPSEPDATATN
ncbi:dipeptidyl aminopeptidase/acylaminoacyl peptidase [Rhodothalassium salexigens DSM 2132]|uniref:Dipeptidyl aminopeptidase/acylaminoacyl peptidase n=1 Tax=Rhodothalassium salexigens DSM 2132 TaxID=1188247 RepID=A0A4R2PBS7_RHOSA|nr:alpha/beta fold hydrolase [Rhodothalassium salexigens]MBB4212269.1 dipeptidyl aminopeptidase/acylaminoacyl peptidase [Rhodothalassium salexigens DSM 2132]MBK1638373.1 S9 family peptidase [Rhodothalassium salexigens DSM 2132]TCP32580.1 dipeptidyl aminopeptidase/acylaminoacyl peptidase [Rhodothalassium salexigens DSM 2132]